MSRPRRIGSWFHSHENRVLSRCLLSGAPGLIFTLVMLFTGDFSANARWTIGSLVVLCWWGFSWAARERVVAPLRTLANLLEAMLEGDYSIRGRGAHAGDALGDVMLQVNALGATLQAQRFGAVEAAALLRKIMHEIDVAVFTFDSQDRLKLANRAAESLVARPAAQMLGLSATGLGLSDLLAGEPQRTVSRTFGNVSGRWSINRSTFRESGLPHTLVVVADLTEALRQEELRAWQRLVRVLGHEINNSLTPIKSIAGSLSRLTARETLREDWRDDVKEGLGVIEARAESLGRFVAAYSQLARLPRPHIGPVEIEPLVRRSAEIERRLQVKVVAGPAVVIQADGDQLEQLLINLIRNGTDASLETGGGVTVVWRLEDTRVVLDVIDEGPGLSDTSNLFVPFFTTKPGGSGIGLALSRQIAEAHGGSLLLVNRQGGSGCLAQLTLPV